MDYRRQRDRCVRWLWRRRRRGGERSISLAGDPTRASGVARTAPRARHNAACPGLRRPETTILEPELRNENPKVISVWTMPTTDRERQSQARRQAGGGLGAYVYGFKVGGVA